MVWEASTALSRAPVSQQAKVAELVDVYVNGEAGEPILRGVDLTVHRGERLLITGESGSGKSTLLRTLGKIVTPASGDVVLFGQNLADLSDAEQEKLVRMQVGFVFQAHNLHDGRTVRANLTSSHDTTRRGRPDLRDVARLAVGLGIAGEHGEMLNSRTDTLSGGQKQRVAIARALLPRPDLLLLDEPTASLDQHGDHSKAAVYEFIDAYAAQTGTTVVMVSHDEAATSIATRHVVMDSGMVLPPPPVVHSA